MEVIGGGIIFVISIVLFIHFILDLRKSSKSNTIDGFLERYLKK
jgi:hypothetical protein